jgi:hypothetical protein
VPLELYTSLPKFKNPAKAGTGKKRLVFAPAKQELHSDLDGFPSFPSQFYGLSHKNLNQKSTKNKRKNNLGF